MNKERLWTKDFISVTATNFLLTLVMYLLLVTIPSYAVDRFHTSTSMAGLVSSIFIIGALIGRLIIGRIIGDFGGKIILVISLLLYVLTSALYLGAVNLPILLMIRILHGSVYGAASTAAGTIMAQTIPHHKRGEGVGYFGMSAILAMAVGPFLGMFLNQHADFNIIFVLNILLAIICLAISFIVNDPVYQARKQEKVKVINKFQISNFIEFKAMPISIVTLIIGFCYSSVLAFLSFYAKELHLVETASFFFLVYAIIVLLTRPFSGRLFDVKGANIVIYPCLLFFVIGMFVLSHVSSGVTLLLAGAFIGLGYGNYGSVAQAIAIKGIQPHRLGLATATFYIFWDLGIGIGPYLLGFFIPFAGYRILYLMMAFALLVAIVLYYFLLGRKENIE